MQDKDMLNHTRLMLKNSNLGVSKSILNSILMMSPNINYSKMIKVFILNLEFPYLYYFHIELVIQ
jgi:hypothetical protein